MRLFCIIIYTEPPSAPTNLTKIVNVLESRVTLLWHSSDVAEEFFVYICPPVEMKSMIITLNTSVVINNMLYNQEYIVRVVASNCAGNSTSSALNIMIGKFHAVII